jgi:RES domain-containing protein
VIAHPLAKIARSTILDAIAELEGCDRAAISIDTLRHQVEALMQGYTCLTRSISAQNSWRARRNINSDYFKNVRDVWYPPADLVSTYGRLNRPGCTILYVAASQQTAILEMRPAVGDIFTILKLRLADAAILPHVMELGFEEKSSQFGLTASVRLVETTVAGSRFLGEEAEKNLLIRSFLAREFVRTVDRGQEQQFKLSVAISENLLSSPEIDGVVYPSMAGDTRTFKGGANIALKPRSADRLYVADACWVSVVESLVPAPPGGYQLRCIKRAKLIQPDGEIVW